MNFDLIQLVPFVYSNLLIKCFVIDYLSILNNIVWLLFVILILKMYSKYFDPIINNHLWVNKHHTCTRLAYFHLSIGFWRPNATRNVIGICKTNFSGWGQWGQDIYSSMASHNGSRLSLHNCGVSFHGSRVSLYCSMVSPLHCSKVSLTRSRVSLHGFRESIHVPRVRNHGSRVSLHSSGGSRHGSSVSHHGSA